MFESVVRKQTSLNRLLVILPSWTTVFNILELMRFFSSSLGSDTVQVAQTDMSVYTFTLYTKGPQSEVDYNQCSIRFSCNKAQKLKPADLGTYSHTGRELTTEPYHCRNAWTLFERKYGNSQPNRTTQQRRLTSSLIGKPFCSCGGSNPKPPVQELGRYNELIRELYLRKSGRRVAKIQDRKMINGSNQNEWELFYRNDF